MAQFLVEQKVSLEVEGRKVQISHIDKLLFPKTGFTKAHVIDYYIRISPFLLPHLRQRPLTLKLYLNGISARPQFIKNAPSYTPAWIKRTVVNRKGGGPQIHFVLVNDLPSLIWAANLNNIETHTFLARAPRIDRPSWMLFDLDPGEPATILDCARVALWTRDKLQALHLKCLVKSSGSKGLHLFVPLNTPVSYIETQAFARKLAEAVAQEHPELVVSTMAKEIRAGKVFVDYAQNADFKSTASVYSLRAQPDGPFVSMPLDWDQLSAQLAHANPASWLTRPAEAVAFCEKSGDLFSNLLTMKQTLPPAHALPGKKPARVSASKSSASRAGHLRTYNRKRDFSRTAEPAGRTVERRAKAVEAPQAGPAPRRFVIQKHAASHLHYDFRLEMQGVLRSWAVPKGPPTRKGERRLAMLVEDHPLEYASFEGTIPKGQYGGGTVMVWDFGTYETLEGGKPAQAFYRGKLRLRLKGNKLKGEWALVRGRSSDQPGKEPWFLIKTGADARAISRRRDDQSAVSGRSMARIAAENTAQWTSHRD